MVPLILFEKSHTHAKTNKFVCVWQICPVMSGSYTHTHTHTHIYIYIYLVNQYNHLVLSGPPKGKFLILPLVLLKKELHTWVWMDGLVSLWIFRYKSGFLVCLWIFFGILDCVLVSICYKYVFMCVPQVCQPR